MEPQKLNNIKGWTPGVHQSPRLRNLAFSLLIFLVTGASVAHASTGTIDTTNKYAWGNVAGWVNFNPTNGAVTVTDSALTGYAWSASDGWINLAPSQSGVKNDGSGNLSGFAWDAAAGWVDFSGVTINSSGKFTGQATGAGGYILNFNCTNCDVETTWRPTTTTTTTSSGGGGSISPVYIPPSSSQTNPPPQTGQPNPLPGSPSAQNTSGKPPLSTNTGSSGIGAVSGAGRGLTGQPAGTQGSTGKTSTSSRPRTLTSMASTASWLPSSKTLQHAAVPISIIAVALIIIFLIRFL